MENISTWQSVMWRIFPHDNLLCGEISPHSRFFLHGHRPWCPWQISSMVSEWVSEWVMFSGQMLSHLWGLSLFTFQFSKLAKSTLPGHRWLASDNDTPRTRTWTAAWSSALYWGWRQEPLTMILIIADWCHPKWFLYHNDETGTWLG